MARDRIPRDVQEFSLSVLTLDWHRLCHAHVGAIKSVTPLSGGLVNHVFRVVGERGQLVAKHAPPHVAAAPDIALDPSRLKVEAAALAMVASCATPSVKAPRVVAYHEDANVLLMEDLGDLGDLFALDDPIAAFDPLATFLRRVHALRPDDLPSFGIHQSRAKNQYLPLAKMVSDPLNHELEWAADHFASPATGLVMGDLWPASVLVSPRQFFIIDWEFATHGHVEQDVAHLSAHVRMRWGETAEDAWLGSYDVGAWTTTQHRAFRVHRAAEILQRTIGAFAGTGGARWLGETKDALIHDVQNEFA
ncbi:MAG: aminoglycoside phosphotransferase family protein [bacterium]